MPALRLIAWNCHHGTVHARLAELAMFAPAIVFLQECQPAEQVPLAGSCVTCQVNGRKGIALASLSADYRITPLRRRPNRGRAVIAATVTGPISFTALGIWGQGPRYADDVLRTLDAYHRVLRSDPAIVLGDLNSGSNLTRQQPSKGHARILAALEDCGLVSAYHAFHDVAHGHETHPTYRHQRNVTKPWHIDFCFVPDSWVQNLRSVEVIDGAEWPKKSDHLPLKVEIQCAVNLSGSL
jgi:endonuclease/exonuclease/phosphatase family metal-dependent hydrolase